MDDERFVLIINGEFFSDILGRAVLLNKDTARTIVGEKMKKMRVGDTIHIQRMR